MDDDLQTPPRLLPVSATRSADTPTAAGPVAGPVAVPAAAVPLLKLGEVAAVLRCTRRTLERQIADRRIAVLHIGRAVRIEATELDAYLDRLRSAEHPGTGHPDAEHPPAEPSHAEPPDAERPDPQPAGHRGPTT